MFKSIIKYPYLVFMFQKEIYVIVVRRRIEEISFNSEFFIFGKCSFNNHDQKELSYLVDQTLSQIPNSFWDSNFIKENLTFEKNGIIFTFNKEYKEDLGWFFKNIPFFT